MSVALRLVYIESSAELRELVRRSLATGDGAIALTEVGSRAEFEAVLAAGGQDAVLADFAPAGYADLELVDCLRQQAPGLPVILLSAREDADLNSAAMRHGAAGHIPRTPENLRVLPDLVREILARHRASRPGSTDAEGFKLLFDRNPLPMWVYDAQTLEFLAVNDAAVAQLGYTREEFGQMKLPDIHPLEEVKRLSQELRKGVAESPPRGEWRYWLKSGQVLDAEIAAAPLEYAGRKAVLAVVQDVTEHQRAKAELRKALSDLENLMETIPEVLFMQDLDGKLVRWNRETQVMSGYSATELLGKPALDLLAETDRPALALAIQETVLKGYRELEASLRCKDGLQVPCQFRVAVLKDDASGQAIGLTWVARDISERKRAEQEFSRLATAIEQSAEGVIIIDLHAIVQYVNPAFERMTGHDRWEVIGQPFDTILRERDVPFTSREIFDQIRAQGSWNGRFTSCRKEGRKYEEEATISPIRDASGQVINYLVASRDVSREAALEEQVRLAQKMEAVGLLAGGVAHDFNNLLQIIHGFTSVAMRGIAKEEKRHGQLEQVLKAADRAASLTRQLLAFSRRQSLRKEDTDLNQLVDDILKMLQRLIGEHIQVTFAPTKTLGNVQADKGQLEQVLLNLCINSRDAMPNGGKITIETQDFQIDAAFAETHPWAKPGQYAVLSVADTGVGMDRVTVRRIFEPFFTTKAKDKGTGLGLSVVYGIVQQHSGLIHVYSEVGVGTTLKIYLPVAKRGVRTPSVQQASAPPGGTETILLAEDEAGVRALTADNLEQAGYRVLTAANGKEAVRIFSAHADQIDLLIFDVVMPEMGGREAYERIRALKPSVPVLFCSGYSGLALQAGYRLEEGMELLQKPYRTDDLLFRIREVLIAGK